MTERDLNRSGVQPIYSQAYGGHAQDKIVWLKVMDSLLNKLSSTSFSNSKKIFLI